MAAVTTAGVIGALLTRHADVSPSTPRPAAPAAAPGGGSQSNVLAAVADVPRGGGVVAGPAPSALPPVAVAVRGDQVVTA